MSGRPPRPPRHRPLPGKRSHRHTQRSDRRRAVPL